MSKGNQDQYRWFKGCLGPIKCTWKVALCDETILRLSDITDNKQKGHAHSKQKRAHTHAFQHVNLLQGIREKG